jgi:ribonuclease Z
LYFLTLIWEELNVLLGNISRSILALAVMGAWLGFDGVVSNSDFAKDTGFFRAARAENYSSPVKSPTAIVSPRGSYYPGTEELAKDEMRVVSCGTGMPAARRGQAATCWLVELGNGDKFLFDIGSGSAANLGSLNIPYDYLDKVFVSHLHQDHVGDMAALWIGGWTGGRHGALNVWGPSGAKPELGTKYFIDNYKKAFSWDYAGRLGIIPTGGGEIKVTEFDYRQDNKIVYQENGVTIRSWPAIHAIDGSVSYGLEWNGLVFVFGGDSLPNKWYVKYAKGADIAIHESFMSPPDMMDKYGFSAQAALNVATAVHTVPAAFGKVMDEAKPRLAIAYHFFNDFDLRYDIYNGIRSTYDGPLTLADDLLVWNVTKEKITLRQIIVDEASWPAKSPTAPDDPDPKAKTDFTKYLTDGLWDVSDVLDPLIAKFKKDNGLK